MTNSTFVARITVAQNGYGLEFWGDDPSAEPKRLVFLTSYTLGQWLDANLPKPPGLSNYVAMPASTSNMQVVADAIPNQGDY